MKSFNDKTVVITGGATGIGFALARQFGRLGANLVLAARRADRLEQAARMLEQEGVTVRTFVCDVTERTQVEALADYAWREFDRVEVIVNNAGVGPVMSSVIDARREDVQRVLDINLFGAWNGVAVFGRRLIDQGLPGAIYNVGSENCFFNAVPGGAGYIASKHALLAMTEALREEVPNFIDVALICPGLVQSELSRETDEGMDADAFAALALRQLTEGRHFVVSHAYNIVRIGERAEEVEAAFRDYAPRYTGDDEYDVRILGARMGWW